MNTQFNEHDDGHEQFFKSTRKARKPNQQKIKYKKKFLEEWLMEDEEILFNNTRSDNEEDFDRDDDLSEGGIDLNI